MYEINRQLVTKQMLKGWVVSLFFFLLLITEERDGVEKNGREKPRGSNRKRKQHA